MGLGLFELAIIFGVVLLFFGASRLPKISRDLGKSARELKKGYSAGENDKSLKDIANDVKTSAAKIKKSIDVVKNPRI